MGIYSKLFDIMEEQSQKNDLQITFSKNTFLYLCNKKPSEANVLQLLSITNLNDFLECCYVDILDRLPDEGARRSWKKIDLKNINHEKIALVQKLIYSQERKAKRTSIDNNICEKKQHNTNNNKVIKKQVNEEISSLKKLYQKLPEPIKNVYRRLRGKFR